MRSRLRPEAKPRPMPVLLRVRVLPRSRANRILGWQDGRLRISLTAPPVEGAANEALLRFLAEVLGVKRRELSLVSGQSGREKTVAVEGLSPQLLEERLSGGMRGE